MGVDAVHHGWIACLAEADNSAVLDTEVALDDAQHRIDDNDVAEQEIERALRTGHTGCQTGPVA